MKTITLNIPDSLEMNNKEFLMIVSTRLYEQGKLSLGQAAELAGLTKRTFAELLFQYNVSLFNFPASDLISDVKNA
jgi:predicted HTH domain antitoxin